MPKDKIIGLEEYRKRLEDPKLEKNVRQEIENIYAGLKLLVSAIRNLQQVYIEEGEKMVSGAIAELNVKMEKMIVSFDRFIMG